MAGDDVSLHRQVEDLSVHLNLQAVPSTTRSPLSRAEEHPDPIGGILDCPRHPALQSSVSCVNWPFASLRVSSHFPTSAVDVSSIGVFLNGAVRIFAECNLKLRAARRARHAERRSHAVGEKIGTQRRGAV